ncbi:ATP-binding protein [Streptomyces sp. NBC_01795]|uniref:ATP-binding protein n=1 Tax=Streptomyces sp. NBC_01795 TaxID=2975943 RepID=UPI002DDB4E7D|nr:ATP-binding protein [Streptomyces sp. NBC_01795]WSA93346.1 ATP-binding protein [Streptomyces sp. NBC_01795]
MQFASTPRCVSHVRTQVENTLHEWGYAQNDIDIAVLVASELATNAVVHGHFPGRPIEVGLAASDETCLVEVSDSSPRPPEAQTATADDESGRGLQLVKALAAQTGQRPRRSVGKTVWARLRMAKRQGCTAPAPQRHATGRCTNAAEGQAP